MPLKSPFSVSLFCPLACKENQCLAYIRHRYSCKQWHSSPFVLVSVGAGSIVLALYCWVGKVKKAKQRIHVLKMKQGLVGWELAAYEIYFYRCLSSTAAELAVFLAENLPPTFTHGQYALHQSLMQSE